MRRSTLPGSGDDVTALIIEARAGIEASPTQRLDVGEVCSPKLVDGRRLVLELDESLQDVEGRTGDQVSRFEQSLYISL